MELELGKPGGVPYGFDTDSRKAERLFKAVEKQAARLRALLGDSAYDTLLWRMERE